MSYPKMTLKVKLSKDKNQIDFDLIQVADVYLNRCALSPYGNSIYISDWMFFVGHGFSINMKRKLFMIPKQPNKSKTFITFRTEKERYDWLKEFHELLLQWSNIEFFKNKEGFTDKPNIKFHNNVWIIF